MKKPLFQVLAVLCVLSSTTAPLAAQAKPGPPSPEMQKLIESATKKYREGDPKGAIALLEPLRARANAHPAALSFLGFLYLETGRPKESLAILGPMADSATAGPLILGSAARAAVALGETQRAEKYLRAAAARSPGSPAVRDLGLLLGNEGQVAESYELLRPWALAHTDDGDARLAATFGAVELGRAAEAEELLNGLPQDNPRVQLLAARTRLLKDDPRGALTLLEPLAGSAPPELLPQVHRALASTYLGVGESAKAVALLQGKVGDDSTLALLLGRAQYKSGHPAEAIAVLEPFAKTALAAQDPAAPGDRAAMADLTLEYGQSLVATSKWAEAIQALDRSTRLNPDSFQAWQLLGRAQLAAGQRDAAAKSMARVRELEAARKKPGR